MNASENPFRKTTQSNHWIHTKMTDWRQARLSLTNILPKLSCLNGESFMEERRCQVASEESEAEKLKAAL